MRVNILDIRYILFAFVFLATSTNRYCVAVTEEQNNEAPEYVQNIEDSNGYFVVTADKLKAKDKEILALVRKAAHDFSRLLEKAVNEGIKTKEEIFSTLYFPVFPETYPPTFNTFYDDYTDRVITPIEDEYLARDNRLLYLAMVDRNGYVPSHNSEFSKVITGNQESDSHYHRSKRIFNDIVGFSAARNTSPFLLQNYPRDTGEIIADLSVPVVVFGRHWGAVRCGYKREE
jgi:hypothetical protein